MKNEPCRTELQLFDALDNLISELYADGLTQKGEDRAQRCLYAFEKKYGRRRHDGKWGDNTT